jgi:small conductance mechanosensitive channel
LFASQLGIWFGGTALILQRFPQTRTLGNWLLRVPLAYTGIFLGMLFLKSILDSLCHLYLQRMADKIRERNADVARLYPRAVTIFAVLQEFNSYVVFILGFLLFFYAINALYIALIILGGIAFLAQSVLQDFVKTYFILAEDQYALGDWIKIGDVNGTVEKVSLRNSQIRAKWGDLYTINHGNIERVTNYTHRYSGIQLWVDVAYSTDLDRAISVMEQVAREMQQDEYWRQYIISDEMKGVEKFGDSGISLRIILMTQISEQWKVAREYRRRLKPAFDEAGITIPFPQLSIWLAGLENKIESN